MAARFATTVERDVAHALAPGSSFILALGTVHGGSTFNQTPDSVHVSGTLRTYSEEDSRASERVMRANLDGIVEAVSKGDLRASYELVVDPGYPVVVNDPAMARRAAGVLGEALGGVDPESRLNFGGEDFAYYLEQVPGLFIFLGTRNPEKGITEVNHSSRFDIDEDVLSLGVEAYTVLVRDILADPGCYGIG